VEAAGEDAGQGSRSQIHSGVRPGLPAPRHPEFTPPLEVRGRNPGSRGVNVSRRWVSACTSWFPPPRRGGPLDGEGHGSPLGEARWRPERGRWWLAGGFFYFFIF
jgi:hypothetical protein